MLVGRIVGHFGLRGQVKIAAADPAALTSGLEVFIALRSGEKAQGNGHRTRIASARAHNRVCVVALAGVESVSAARALLGASVLAARADLPKPPSNAFRAADLLGLEVIDASMGSLGRVQGVRHYPSCDMLVVGAKKMLVPALAAYEIDVDVDKGAIRVNLPPGFDEL